MGWSVSVSSPVVVSQWTHSWHRNSYITSTNSIPGVFNIDFRWLSAITSDVSQYLIVTWQENWYAHYRNL